MGLGNVGTRLDSEISLSPVMKHGVEENKSLLVFRGKTPPFLIKDPFVLDIFPDRTKVG